jgi:hypothetical protein
LNGDVSPGCTVARTAVEDLRDALVGLESLARASRYGVELDDDELSRELDQASTVHHGA